MDLKPLVFPRPDLQWDEDAVMEELIWIPYPNYSFKQLKPIYDDVEYEQQIDFLKKTKKKFDKVPKTRLKPGNAMEMNSVFNTDDPEQEFSKYIFLKYIQGPHLNLRFTT